MACPTCGAFILFGGVKDGGRRYCNPKCHAEGEAIRLEKEVPDALVEKLAIQMHGDPCPECDRFGPVDIHESSFVYSIIVSTHYKTTKYLLCKKCATAQQTKDFLGSLAAGWWGIPFGIIITPAILMMNVASMLKNPGRNGPSSALQQRARSILAAHMVAQGWDGRAVAPPESAAPKPFPSSAITVLNGFAPRGPVDTLLRQLAAKLSERLGQPVVVENRAGESGTMAGAAVARAKPDGYTLLFGMPGNLAVVPATMKTPPYEPTRAFATISEVARGPYVLMARADIAAANLQEFIALGKSRELRYGSPGPGSTQHLASEMLRQATGLAMKHAPYKAGGSAEAALAGDEVDAVFDTIPAAMAAIRAGKARALAVTGSKRAALLPDVRTLGEQGVAGVNAHFWCGFVGPAGLPKDIVARLNGDVAAALADPGLKAAFSNAGIEPSPGTAEAFAVRVKLETSLWKDFVANAGLDRL